MSQSAYQPLPKLSPRLAQVHVVSFEPHANQGLSAARLMAVAVVMSGAVIVTSHAAGLRSLTKSFAKPTVTTSQSTALAPHTTPNQTRLAPTTSTSPPATAPAAQPAEPDSAALQAILNDWQSDNPGGTFGVVVQELGGQKRSASLQPNLEFEAASLYKLFLAQTVYGKIDQGQLALTDSLSVPYDVGDCLERMIVISDNDCGMSLGDTVGWTQFNQDVQAAGFNETVVSPVNTTSASDVASFLEQLQAGTLMSQNDTQTLLSYMQQQIYRSAIPAGVSAGVAVADKVGYIEDYWHDAAIIYNPKGDYVLVVLTKDSGPAAIADLSSRVNSFMNQ